MRKFLFLALATTFMLSCTKKTTPVVLDNFDMLINANADLSLFKAALIKSGLTTFTQGRGPFTIYAPNNAAFIAAGITSDADIAAIDPTTLVKMLTNHIQSGARTSYEIPVGPNGTIGTVGGFTNYTSVLSNVQYINGAKFLTTDIKASNGIMHIIDRLLVPAVNTVLINLGLNPNHKLFLQAINKCLYTSFFSTSTAIPAITVFVPTNTAMTAAGYDSVRIANATSADTAALRIILKYHIINTRVFQNDLKDGNWKTAQGTNVVVSSVGTKVKGTSNPTPFSITLANIPSTNGVLHQIDGLLKP